MVDEGERKDPMAETRRLQGNLMGLAYAELVERVLFHSEEIKINEWYILAQLHSHRPETAQALHQVLDWCRQSNINPGEFEAWKRKFLEVAAMDVKYLFLVTLKDSVGYYGFLLAGRRVARPRRARNSETLGLS